MTTLPASLEVAISEFFEQNEYARAWAVYPAVDEELDERMPACHGMSRSFTEFLRARGFTAELVQADGCWHPDADYHFWARVQVRDSVLNVDWTARQFHNLEPQVPGQHALPCPLVWEGDGPEHPIVGGYDRVGPVPVELNHEQTLARIETPPASLEL